MDADVQQKERKEEKSSLHNFILKDLITRKEDLIGNSSMSLFLYSQ